MVNTTTKKQPNAAESRRYDKNEVKTAARGRWGELLNLFASIPADYLDGRHHDCPLCGQGTDRFRALDDFGETGAVYCNKCHDRKNGDGFAAIAKATGKPFPEVLADVGEYLGVQPRPSKNGDARRNGQKWKDTKKRRDPLAEVSWFDEQVAKVCSPWLDGWCQKKPPVTPRAAEAFGGRLCRWPKTNGHLCIGFTGRDMDGTPKAVLAYRVDGQPFPATKNLSERKTHLVAGSTESWLFPGDQFPTAASVFHKCEGLPDALTLASAGLPDDHVAMTNACGAKSHRKLDYSWAKSKGIVIAADADLPGVEGGKLHAARAHQAGAAWVKLITPPGYEIADDGGRDFRDWFAEGHTMDEYLALVDAAEPVTQEDIAKWKASRKSKSSTPRITLENIDDPHDSDLGNAKRFAKLYGGNCRYCQPWRKWLIFTGKRWEPDRTGEVQRAAKDTIRRLWLEAIEEGDSRERDRLLSHAKKSESASAIENMIRLAQTEGGIPIVPEQFNTHIWKLNCENGTLDLKTGTLLPHSREDYLTQIVPVAFDASAKAPRWEQFLIEVFLDNPKVICFVQRLFGYSLTGSTRDHCLPILYGKGSNGKSTMVETFFAVLGTDYSMKGTHDFLMAKQNAHPTEKADLFGRRFVGCVETEDGKRLAESFVKELTGGDRIRARRMREDFWEFPATHKVWLASNHKPKVRGTDRGIWRRIHLIPFSASFEGASKDTSLPEKLHAELPGILNWALAGCLEWQRIGLDPPEEVKAATDQYRLDEDTIGKFIDECCVVDSTEYVGATDLFRAYQRWSGSAISQTTFGNGVSERDFDKTKISGRIVYIGIGLQPEFTSVKSEDR